MAERAGYVGPRLGRRRADPDVALAVDAVEQRLELGLGLGLGSGEQRLELGLRLG